MLRPRIAVIGAGPSGLMAAEVAARRGAEVVVFERMASPARKLLMAGRGGLNLTHSEPRERFLARYGAKAAALSAAISGLPPEALVAWAAELGIETFIGSSGRIFPKAMKASPLLRAWLKRLAVQGVELKTRHSWVGLPAPGQLSVRGPDGVLETHQADAVILAVGGASWPRLGADGSWVAPLREAGVAITPLEASNAGAKIAWTAPFLARAEGQALKRIAVRVGDATERGEVVITRRGLEGGAIYALAAAIRAATRDGEPATLFIDLKPDESEGALALRLARPRGKMSTANFLRKAAALSPAAIALAREGSPAHALPAAPNDLARLLKAVPLKSAGLAGLERAISSAGGVSFEAIDDNFMLRAMPGVFAAGEMLDWDAPTGGYLLQAAFATGAAAAEGALSWLAGSSDSGVGSAEAAGDRSS